MKKRSTLLATALTVMIVCGWGCGKKGTAVDATKPLDQSFKTAEPSVQQAVNRATTDLKAGNYAEATRTLAPVVSGRPLTAAQKQAVGLALQQVNQSIATNPKLDTKEMYELRKKMFEAVHSGPRF